MNITATLPKEQWDLILEALDVSNRTQISKIAIGFLSPVLNEDFIKKTQKKESI